MLPEELEKELSDTLPCILNIRDICSVMNVSDKTVRREIKRKNGLNGYLADGEWNITRSDFLEYLSRVANQ